MQSFGDSVKKAFYLGVGLVSLASEKASTTIGELRQQAQKLADEMVARGEITTEEARKLVDEMVNRAQQVEPGTTNDRKSSEPRKIEIVSDDEEPAPENPEKVDALRQQVAALQEELRRLQRD